MSTSWVGVSVIVLLPCCGHLAGSMVLVATTLLLPSVTCRYYSTTLLLPVVTCRYYSTTLLLPSVTCRYYSTTQLLPSDSTTLLLSSVTCRWADPACRGSFQFTRPPLLLSRHSSMLAAQQEHKHERPHGPGGIKCTSGNTCCNRCNKRCNRSSLSCY